MGAEFVLLSGDFNFGNDERGLKSTFTFQTRMCECGKGYVMPKYLTELTNDTWGPTIWKLLHILSSRMGDADEMMDGDAAQAMYFVVNRVHEVLPCLECQNHTRAYLAQVKFDPRGLRGADLRTYVERWLLDFHNAVRERKGQPRIVDSVEMYHALWRPQVILPCDNEALKLYFDYAKLYKIIRIDNYTRWVNTLTRLRLLLGI